MKKFKNVISSLIIILVFIISLASVTFSAAAADYISMPDNPGSYEQESGSVKKTITLGVGESVSDKEFSNPSYTYYTDNQQVAAVNSNCEFTGIAAGDAKVTVVNDNKAVAVITVSVKNKPEYSLNSTAVMAVGTKQKVKVVFHNDSYSNYSSFTSGNTSVATVVSDGVVTAKSAGKTKITYKAYDNSTKSVEITVKAMPSSLSISASSKTLMQGEGFNLNASLNSGAYPAGITYSTTNRSVASVSSSGRVTAVGEGKAVITAKTENGLVKSCVVYVYGKNAITLNYNATRISMDYSNVTKVNYGTSVMGRNLEAFIINGSGNNSKTIFVDFAVHGFEDSYARDGQVLVEAANDLVEYFAENPDSLKNYRIVIVPCANPDGTIDGVNNNRANSTAFGRCTADHVDMNRDFGDFRGRESRALRDLMYDYEMDIYINFHGWLNSVLGNPELVSIFRSTNNLSRDQSGSYGADKGYIIGWVKNHIGAKAALVEFKSPGSVDYRNIAAGIERAVSSGGFNKTPSMEVRYDYSLAAVKNVTRTGKTDSSISLKWDSVSGAKGYEVQIYKNGEWITAKNVFGTTSATIDDLNSGTEYRFSVRAFTYSGNVRTYTRNWSETVRFYTAPHKVYGLKTVARSQDATEIKISWTPQLDADGYNIYTKASGKWVLVESLAGGASSTYTFTGLTPGWEYYYKITAYKGQTGNAGYGSEELHSCAACPPMPEPKVSLVSENKIRVDWDVVNSHGYVVMWSTSADFSKNVDSAYVVGHNSYTYSFTTKESSKNYYVRVRPWRYFEDTLVYGNWSDALKAANVVPDKVTGLVTTARGGYGEKLRISWDIQPNADGYHVYQKISGKYQLVASTAENSYTFENLVPGWEYYFRVTAYKGDPSNTGYASDELHTCAACPPMDAPVLTKTAANTIQVDWSVVNSHGYVIQWSTDQTFEKDLNSLYVTGHDWDSYSITTKDDADHYFVRIRAWRNFEGGMVYGLWSQPQAVIPEY